MRRQRNAAPGGTPARGAHCPSVVIGYSPSWRCVDLQDTIQSYRLTYRTFQNPTLPFGLRLYCTLASFDAGVEELIFAEGVRASEPDVEHLRHP